MGEALLLSSFYVLMILFFSSSGFISDQVQRPMILEARYEGR